MKANLKSKGVWIIMALTTMFVIGCSFSGSRPAGLGVDNDRLSACPDKPNCVSSQSEDPKHFIEPFSYTGEKTKALEALKQVVAGLERTKIIEESSSYLYAESSSKVFGFVDDVEFYLPDNASVVHVRSASRLGYSDLGVNKKRVETIRSEFIKVMAP